MNITWSYQGHQRCDPFLVGSTVKELKYLASKMFGGRCNVWIVRLDGDIVLNDHRLEEGGVYELECYTDRLNTDLI